MQQGSLIQERSEARNLARKVRRASCSQAWQEAARRRSSRVRRSPSRTFLRRLKAQIPAAMRRTPPLLQPKGSVAHRSQ